jgi:PAS domain S-box-containing protein
MGDRPARAVIVSFVIATACGPAMVLLPGPDTDWALFAISCVLMALVVAGGLVAVRSRRGRHVVLPMALVYLVAAGILRHSVVGSTSGFWPLAMLPIVWLALYGDRRMLILGLAAMAVTLVAPQFLFGSPQYPPATLRSGVLLIVVASIAALAIQLLLSDARSARDALTDERDFSGAVIETVGSLVVVLDREGRVERFNRTSERVSGRRAEDILGKRPWEVGLVPPEAVAEVEQGVARAHPGAFPHDYESEWLTAFGERRLIAWSATCLVDDRGELTHIINTGIDITDQRRSEEQLKVSTDRLQGILEHATAIIAVADRDGRFVLANPAWMEYVGADPVGRTVEEVLAPDVAAQVRATDEEVLRTGRALE